MTVMTRRPQRNTMQLELSADGYLRLDHHEAEHFFPGDTLLVMWREGTLVLLPTRGAAAGGLMLKTRNLQGDRSVLVAEAFEFQMPTGQFTATWDESIGGLRVHLSAETES